MTTNKAAEATLKGNVGDLILRRAQVIEEVMKLRAEQARLKTEIVKAAVESGDRSLIAAIPRCW